MIIRAEQMKAFEEAAVENFDAGVAAELKQHYPKHCEAMGDGALRTLVRSGREQASKHGFKTSRSIRLYIHLMPALGSYFAGDPQLPWAGAILARGDFKDERQRTDALNAKAAEYVKAISGPDGGAVKQAIEKLKREKPEGFAKSGGAPFDEYMLRRLASVYPEKVAYVGEDTVRTVIRGAVDAARKYGLTTETGVMLLSVLMFMLGTRFDEDPQFGWAAAILNDSKQTDAVAKARSLHEAALGYLQRFAS